MSCVPACTDVPACTPLQELVEAHEYIEVNGVRITKPFVEKPLNAEDHNVYIYYPDRYGGGHKRLFRKVSCPPLACFQAYLDCDHTHLPQCVAGQQPIQRVLSRPLLGAPGRRLHL